MRDTNSTTKNRVTVQEANPSHREDRNVEYRDQPIVVKCLKFLLKLIRQCDALYQDGSAVLKRITNTLRYFHAQKAKRLINRYQ